MVTDSLYTYGIGYLKIDLKMIISLAPVGFFFGICCRDLLDCGGEGAQILGVQGSGFGF